MKLLLDERQDSPDEPDEERHRQRADQEAAAQQVERVAHNPLDDGEHTRAIMQLAAR